MNISKVALHIARFLAALIMLQTLYFKFSGAEESIYIFTEVGMEPWGRYLVGASELVASVLLLIPSVAVLGALLAISLMLGAIGMHLTLLGIEVQGDGGYLFTLALIVLVSSVFVLYQKKEDVKGLLGRLLG